MNALLDVFPLALLGAVLGLDSVSFPQAMLSRPLVAATLGGALVGGPVQGLLVGALLELIALETLPFGASRYPEWGAASVVGGSLLAAHPLMPPGALATSLLGALATAWAGGWSMVELRRLNGRWARQRLPALERGSYRTVVGLQLSGLTADLVRGGLLTAVALLAMRPLVEACAVLWTVDARVTRAIAAGTSAMVAAGATWKIFHGVSRAGWYLAGGLVVGFLLLLGQ